MRLPDLREEQKLWSNNVKYIAGVDEVGRGPLAGPVVAAAVIIHHESPLTSDEQEIFYKKMRDSKKLSAIQREKIFDVLTHSNAIHYGIGIVPEKIIDEINILQASLLAMEYAIRNISCNPDFLLIDGPFTLENISLNQKAIVNGDEKVTSIAMASIIAKVTRDRFMIECDQKYPQYSFALHKGYGTKLHLDALKKYGPCEIHRKSFGPVKKMLT